MFESRQVENIGFVFRKDCEWICIDLDKVRNAETGEVAEWAQRVIDQFTGIAYIEISLSSCGFHIIFEGQKSEWMTGTTATVGHPFPESKIEVFDEKFVILTGDTIEGSVRDFTSGGEVLESVYLELFSEAETKTAKPINGPIRDGSRNATLASLAGSLHYRSLPADVILDALQSTNRKRCEHSLSDTDVKKIVLSITTNYEAGEPAQPQTQMTFLQKHLKLPSLEKVIKRGRQNGEFELILSGGQTVEIGTAAHVLSLNRVRAAIFDAVGEVIRSDKRNWPQVAKAIASLAEVIEVESDLSVWEGRVQRVFLGDGFGECAMKLRSDSEDKEDFDTLFSLIKRGESFFLDDVLNVSVEHFRVRLRSWDISYVCSTQECAKWLSRLGFVSRQVKRTHKGEQVNRRYWVRNEAGCSGK